jgi:DNA (cytosine-5)-methyltransferase 1
MKEVEINHLDLFSGIGGFHLGFERAGFKINSYFSEIDKYAIQVYKDKFKNSNYVGSVTDVRGGDLPDIDLITFGSPCQDFSLAGKRKGLGGERSSLISEAIRLIREKRPRVFVWENVKGTFSSNNRQDFAAILQAFANIGGYRLEWQLLNTKWFLPQNRERIYLVGYLGDGSGGQIFPIGESFGKDYNEISLFGDTNKGGERGVIYNTEGIVGSLTATDYKQPKQIKVNSATSNGYEVAEEGDSINYSVPTSKTRRGRVGKGVAQTLDTACNQAVIGAMRGRNPDNPFIKIGDYRSDEGYRERKDGCSPTLTAGNRANSNGSVPVPFVNKIRRLTPIECERLQGFPDDWTKQGTEGMISDTQRYKMCGNAVTVDVVAAVAERIKQVVYA